MPANLVTSASLSAGVLALLLGRDQVALATALVVLAGVLDGVDGHLARRRGGDHRFGAQLDSLTDLLCFCVVPAVVLARAVGPDHPVAGRVVAVAFVLGGAWRLARFPLVKESGHFVGLPTPSAGGLTMLLTLWAPEPVALVGALVLAWLMCSTLRVPTVVAAAATVRPGRKSEGDPRRRRLRTGRPRVLGR
ncbi:MAG: CDP-diacylglycerol--serine O-phosphatidyltransferase, partial [Frankiales bacterium]|nr:CDP-diacylglycerol--serine O-phosphatidyltransferase [Frankiales bacterium]